MYRNCQFGDWYECYDDLLIVLCWVEFNIISFIRAVVPHILF